MKVEFEKMLNGEKGLKFTPKTSMDMITLGEIHGKILMNHIENEISLEKKAIDDCYIIISVDSLISLLCRSD